MTQQSLADLAVQTLAAVSQMTDGVNNDHPDRHTIRAMKRIAESILQNAFTEASTLAIYARDLQREMRKLHEKDTTQ